MERGKLIFYTLIANIIIAILGIVFVIIESKFGFIPVGALFLWNSLIYLLRWFPLYNLIILIYLLVKKKGFYLMGILLFLLSLNQQLTRFSLGRAMTYHLISYILLLIVSGYYLFKNK